MSDGRWWGFQRQMLNDSSSKDKEMEATKERITSIQQDIDLR